MFLAKQFLSFAGHPRLARLQATSLACSYQSVKPCARKATNMAANDQGGDREVDYLEFAINDNARLVLSQGDITKWDGDALVNAANQRMLGGGGVDGAIHRAAGPELLEACKEVKQIRPGVRCPTGEARITPGFNLKAKYVIHTVGPIFESAAESAPFLASSYRNSLKLANEKGLKTIAFPAISTGVYGYPVASAAEVSLHAIAMSVGNIEEVHFVLFGTPTFNAYRLMYGLWEYLFRKEVYQMLILGLDKAGKTNVLEHLKTMYTTLVGLDPGKILPTVGLNVGRLDAKGQSIVLWDLGGQPGLQSIWDKYYDESHAVIFVVDAANPARFAESKAAFDRMRSSRQLAGAPLLVMANKQDLDGAVGVAELSEFFGIGKTVPPDAPPIKVVPVCAYTGQGLKESIEWLVHAVRISPRAQRLRVSSS